MSETKQLQTLFKVSEVLLKAFEEIHQITGSLISQVKQGKLDKKQEDKKKPKSVESTERKEDKKDSKKDNKKEKPIPQIVEVVKEQKKPKKEQVADKIQEKVKQEKVQKKQRKERHPDKPKFPITPFFRFNNSSIEKIKSEYPKLTQTQLVSISGMLWKNLTPEQKEPYEKQYKLEKIKYDQTVEKFYNQHPEERPKNGHKKQ